MNRALVIIGITALAVLAMFYVLEKNVSVPTHIHFTTREGAPKQVIYYSAKAPEAAPQHQCDGSYVEMLDHLYQTHFERWKEKYEGSTGASQSE